MENLRVDTEKLNTSGEDIITLTRELNEELNAFFERVTNIGVKTNEWIGASSQEFVTRTNMEKIYYNKIVNTLNSYGKILISASNEYKTHVNKLR